MAQCLGNLWKNGFFNKGSISDLILLGTADKHDLLQKKCQVFFDSNMFFLKKMVSQDFLPQQRTCQTMHEFRTIWKNVTIANLATNQDATLIVMIQNFVFTRVVNHDFHKICCVIVSHYFILSH